MKNEKQKQTLNNPRGSRDRMRRVTQTASGENVNIVAAGGATEEQVSGEDRRGQSPPGSGMATLGL